MRESFSARPLRGHDLPPEGLHKHRGAYYSSLLLVHLEQAADLRVVSTGAARVLFTTPLARGGEARLLIHGRLLRLSVGSSHFPPYAAFRAEGLVLLGRSHDHLTFHRRKLPLESLVGRG